MIELYIRKEDGFESELLKLLDNGYKVLFDNDGEKSDYYWIRLAHPEWTESSFFEIDHNEFDTVEDALKYLHDDNSTK